MKARHKTGEAGTNIFGQDRRLLHQSRALRPDSGYEVSNWMELAACLGKSDTFTLMSHEVGKELKLTLLDVWRINTAKVRVAKGICATCPVSGECLAAATPLDRTESVWGGQTPTNLSASPPVNRSIGSRDGRPCVNGHRDEWSVSSRGYHSCLACGREKNERARRKAAEREGREYGTANKDQTHCLRGHPLPEKNIHGKRVCMPCRRIIAAEYRERHRAKLEE